MGTHKGKQLAQSIWNLSSLQLSNKILNKVSIILGMMVANG